MTVLPNLSALSSNAVSTSGTNLLRVTDDEVLRHKEEAEAFYRRHERYEDVSYDPSDSVEVRVYKTNARIARAFLDRIATEDAWYGTEPNSRFGTVAEWREWKFGDRPELRSGPVGYIATVLSIVEEEFNGKQQIEFVIYIIQRWLRLETTLERANVMILRDILNEILDWRNGPYSMYRRLVAEHADRLAEAGLLSGRRPGWQPLYDPKLTKYFSDIIENEMRPGGRINEKDKAEYPSAEQVKRTRNE